MDFRYDECGLWTTFKYEYSDRVKDHTKDHTKDKYQLSDQQEKIIRYLIEHPQATRKELVENIADATLGGIIYNLARLKELGLIRREGGQKRRLLAGAIVIINGLENMISDKMAYKSWINLNINMLCNCLRKNIDNF